MTRTALVTTPNSDVTIRYISTWAEKTVQELKSSKLEFIVLEKERVTKSILESMLKKHLPSLIFINGHGGPDMVCGQHNEILIRAGQNEYILKGSVTYSLSCSSASILGQKAVDAGATAYIGYDNDFIFFISPKYIARPLEDKTAELFLAPANHAIVSLVKGHTTSEACLATRSYFFRNIQKMISSESVTGDREYIRFLIWNMKSLVCRGDQKATVV